MQRNEHFSSRSDEKCECAGLPDSHFSSLRDEKCSFLCISRRSLRSLLEMRTTSDPLTETRPRMAPGMRSATQKRTVSRRRSGVSSDTVLVRNAKVQVVVGEAARHRIHPPRARPSLAGAPVAQHMVGKEGFACASGVFVAPALQQPPVSAPAATRGASARRHAGARGRRPSLKAVG